MPVRVAFARAVCLSALVAGLAAARTPPPAFDLDTCTGQANQILIGRMDTKGAILVSEVITGTVKAGDRFVIAGGEGTYTQLFNRMEEKDAVEIVAFLAGPEGGRLLPVQTWGGIAGLQRARGGCRVGGADFVMRPGEDRVAFIASVHGAKSALEECRALLASPRSGARTAALCGFLLKHDPTPTTADPFDDIAKYYLGEISAGLKSSSPEEQAELLKALQQAKLGRDQRVLIDLAGMIPVGDFAFAEVARYLDRGYSGDIRRAAIQALGKIDGFRAVEAFIPLLELEEPELLSVLRSMGPLSIPPSETILNARAIDPLVKLALGMRALQRREGDQVMGNEGYAMLFQLARYAHPKLMPILYDWAISKDAATSAQAMSTLRSTTGLELPLDDLAAWQAWWRKAKPFFERDYDLSTEPGRSAWMDAWEDGDSAVRKILLGLWFFEPEIDEAWLLSASDHHEAARQALAEIWRRERLTAPVRKAIVEHFLTFRISADPGPAPAKELKIIAKTSFPFPPNASVQWGSRIATDNEVLTLDEGDDGFGNGSNLENANNGLFGSRGTLAGAVPVRAVVQLREVDYLHGGQVLWSLKRELDPVEPGALGK